MRTALVVLGLGSRFLAQGTEALPGDPFARLDPALQQTLGVLDPSLGGWESEARSDAAAVQLKRIAKYLEDPARKSADLEGVFASGFRFSAPGAVREAHADEIFRLRRPGAGPGEPVEGSEPFLRLFTDALKDALGIHAKFKFVGVEPGAEEFTTQALLIVVAERPQGSLQLNSW